MIKGLGVFLVWSIDEKTKSDVADPTLKISIVAWLLKI